MTISFPRDLIEPFGVRSCVFEPREMQARSGTRGGLLQVVSLGPTVWQMRYELVVQTEDQAAEWEAWLLSMRGGLKLFKAWHPLRRYARNYPSGYGALTRHGGGAFDGTATLTAVGGSLDTLTLSTLPSTFQFKVGDMVSFPYTSTSQSLHQVVEAATASGGVATIAVEPTVRAGVTTGVTATVDKPWCHAVLDPGAKVEWEGPGRRGRVSISAVQTL